MNDLSDLLTGTSALDNFNLFYRLTDACKRVHQLVPGSCQRTTLVDEFNARLELILRLRSQYNPHRVVALSDAMLQLLHTLGGVENDHIS